MSPIVSRITIVHGGQTGVDRGAHLGAEDARLAVDGYLPIGARDEYGDVPYSVRASLRSSSCSVSQRTDANVRMSDAVIVIVPSEDWRSPGTDRTRLKAEKMMRPIVRVTRDEREKFAEFVRTVLEFHVSPLIMIAGPRQSLWRDGEGVAREFVRSLREI